MLLSNVEFDSTKNTNSNTSKSHVISNEYKNNIIHLDTSDPIH